MRRVRAGELRHRITLLRRVEHPDGMGGATVSWEAAGKMWARVMPMTSGDAEADQAGAPTEVADYRIAFRMNGLGRTVTSSDAIEWQGERLSIVNAGVPDPREGMRMITCKTGVAL